MNVEEIVFLECHLKDFFYQEHKSNLFFGNFSWMLILKNTSIVNLLDAFYK
jgi:hypothetical protein